MPPSDKNKTPSAGGRKTDAPASDREARLAEALRANLRRRKAAAKSDKTA